MRTMHFTTRAIEDLDLEAHENDVWIWDADGSGLGLRMRRGKTGTSKTYYAYYRHAGQKRRDRLGEVNECRLDDARNDVYEIKQAARKHEDPREAKLTAKAKAVTTSKIPTFADYAADHLLANAKDWSPSFYRNTARYLSDGPHSGPFRRLRLDQITKAMIASHVKLLESKGIEEQTPQGNIISARPSKFTAQLWRVAVGRLFDAAIQDGLVETNPVRGTRSPAPSGKKQTMRERVLTNDELAAVWNASGDDTYGKLTKLAILLGCRRQELGGMRWSEIDQKNWHWTIPKERTKMRRALLLPLPPAAIEIIRSVPKIDEDGLIFGGGTGQEYGSWSYSKRLLDARIGIAPWRFHDLRRTLINGLHNLIGTPHIVMAITGHAGGTTIVNGAFVKEEGSEVHFAHYANQLTLYLPQKTEALKRWADHVLALAGKNVVPIEEAA